MIVTCSVKCPKSVRWYRSVTFAAAVKGLPWISSHRPSLIPAVCTTKVSPSQCPTEYPFQPGIRIDRQRTPIEKNLPIAFVIFLHQDEESGCLDQLVQTIVEILNRSKRKAIRFRFRRSSKKRTIKWGTLLHDLGVLGTQRQSTWNTGSDIKYRGPQEELCSRDPLSKFPGKIGLAVGHLRVTGALRSGLPSAVLGMPGVG